MESSLYQISDDLRAIFNEIDMNEGEITPELDEALTITQENLKDKLNSYKNCVIQYKGDVDSLKCEAKRLKERTDVLNNRITKLKSKMLDAVNEFGCEGKTNKYIELTDARIFTRNSTSTEIDERRVSALILSILNYIKTEYNPEEEFDGDKVIKSVNEYAKLHFFEEGDREFTLDDMMSIHLNISREYTLNELLYQKFGITNDIKNEETIPTGYEITLANSKTDLNLELNIGHDLTFANHKITQSIQIK